MCVEVSSFCSAQYSIQAWALCDLIGDSLSIHSCTESVRYKLNFRVSSKVSFCISCVGKVCIGVSFMTSQVRSMRDAVNEKSGG